MSQIQTIKISQLMTKMKEDAEKERIEQEEQEILEKQKKLAMAARRCSSPALQRQQTISEVVPARAVNSEPITRHSQFVSLLTAFLFITHIKFLFRKFLIMKLVCISILILSNLFSNFFIRIQLHHRLELKLDSMMKKQRA